MGECGVDQLVASRRLQLLEPAEDDVDLRRSRTVVRTERLLAANINIGGAIGFDRGFDRFERMRRASAADVDVRPQQWMSERVEDQPLFVYLHFNDVHAPYKSQSPWFTPHSDRLENIKARYDSEISYVDDTLRKMFERFGWLDGDTVVAVLSDHGEEFEEHSQVGHHVTLYRELVQILTLFYAPILPALYSCVTDPVSVTTPSSIQPFT